jgi:hypothetical protein
MEYCNSVLHDERVVKMFEKHLKHVIFAATLSLLFILAACGGSSDTGNSTSQQSQNSQNVQSSTTVIATTPATGNGSPGVGPIVILSPTPVPGGSANSQQVVLPDRTLIISNVSKQAGTDANVTTINLAVTVKNTGSKSIMNEANFFQLIGAEGDTFGLQSNSASNFFGSIAAHSERSSTLAFQVPTGTLSQLRLFYRSEVATETVFVTLHV